MNNKAILVFAIEWKIFDVGVVAISFISTFVFTFFSIFIIVIVLVHKPIENASYVAIVLCGKFYGIISIAHYFIGQVEQSSSIARVNRHVVTLKVELVVFVEQVFNVVRIVFCKIFLHFGREIACHIYHVIVFVVGNVVEVEAYIKFVAVVVAVVGGFQFAAEAVYGSGCCHFYFGLYCFELVL